MGHRTRTHFTTVLEFVVLTFCPCSLLNLHFIYICIDFLQQLLNMYNCSQRRCWCSDARSSCHSLDPCSHSSPPACSHTGLFTSEGRASWTLISSRHWSGLWLSGPSPPYVSLSLWREQSTWKWRRLGFRGLGACRTFLQCHIGVFQSRRLQIGCFCFLG